METYLCQMDGYDVDEDWSPVTALDAQDAAATYAEQCERRSGGDMLSAEFHDKEIVRVRPPDDDDDGVVAFEVTVSSSKIFFASEM